ncbi:MAG: heparan-alpha-glucosaminide N-acetyltransferase domain-containing protein [Bacteroidota bacterium]
MKNPTDRIQFIDIMRGVAVVVMVVGHSIDSVLSNGSRSSEMFRLYDAVRGFTAPMFLFVSGLAFSVATEKKWDAYRHIGRPLFHRLGRILLLLIIGYALHLPFFSLNKILYQATSADYAQLFQADVLHCVAISLLILQAIVLCVRTPRTWAIVVSIIAMVCVCLSPVVWGIDFAPLVSPILSPYFNQTQISIFPLFPFSGFLFIGAMTGHFFLNARRHDLEREFFKKISLAGIVMGICGIVFEFFPISLYSPHDYWKSSPIFFFVRLAIVFVLTSGFFFLRSLPDIVSKNIILLGQSSLLVYVLHIMIVYGSPANSGLAQIVGRALSYPSAIAVGALVLFCMLGVVYGWNTLHTRHVVRARYIQVTLVSLIVLIFLIKPH